MQKIIFFDIDGTLVTRNNELPKSTKRAIIQLKDNGHIPVIATGRPPKMLKAVTDALKIDSYISLNGQYIVVNGKNIYTNTLPTDEIQQLISTSYELDHRTFLLTENNVIGNTFMSEMVEDPEFLTFVYSNLGKLSEDILGQLFIKMTDKPLDRFRYEDEEVLAAFINTNEKYDSIYKDTFPNFHFTRATPFMSEVLMKGAHKAVGMEKVCRYFGKTLNDTIAFGDSLNDIEMIREAKIGVAMGNARDELKVVSDHVTSHVEKDGIYHALKELEII